MSRTDLWTLLTIVGMVFITVLTRAFFFLSNNAWELPAWVEKGLKYAPIAALAAVVVPEIVTSSGQLVSTWKDARLFAAAFAIAWFFWRRSLLGTILAGMAVYLPLHLGWG
ncbi:MAG: AzlD domain-containing protein, partial [Gammaproteobacteria bacterium]|nr:AzlD domain-containing protein [Gammaproteobacteria bacterium]